ncbi:phage tail spike protein [Alkalibacterium thalassium]|uniref:Phage minor structural protein, N-terminal region n=1 Tax=Alkalibacterium thalassium TaxID=426701 RepID=A0A1G8VP74_9LACT|nr:phage tail spike protein [Alkalibacterium thalassium]SDJ67749.1 phage minor structural protein, N-terminal region [Alkalibacterium thalassium]
MSYPILYKANEADFSTLGLGVLSDATSALVTEERNGQFYLIMQYPIDGIRFNELKNDRVIKVDASNNLKDQRFKIERITKPSKGIVTVYANHVSYHSEELQLRPDVSYNGNAQSALTTWRSNLVDSHPFTVYSDIQTEGSGRWSIDKVENARRALGGVQGSILDSYGGEYRFDNYHIGLYAQRGDESGALIAYGKNLIELEQEEEIASTYTSVYPYSVIYNDDGEEELITLPEYFIDSEYVANYARRKILTVDFSDEDIKTADSLRTRAQRYIKENNVGVPRVNLKVKFIDLSKTLDYKHLKLVEEINLCDWVDIYFEKLDIVRKAKIIAATWDVLLERYHEIEVGESRASLSRSIDTTIERRLDPVSTRLNIIQTAANGKNSVFRGPTEPLARKVGDLWYKPVGDGEMEMYQWNGAIWELVVSTAVNSEIDTRIEDAKGIAEQARDHSNLLQLDADSILAGLGIEGITEMNQNIVNQIKANVGDRIDELVSNVDELPTVAYVKQEINRVEGSITTEIAKVTSNPSGTIAGYNTLVQTAERNEQLIASIKTTPEAEIVGYQRIVEQADLYERVIGITENDIDSNVSRIVQSSGIIQTEVSSQLERGTEDTLTDKTQRFIPPNATITLSLSKPMAIGTGYEFTFSVSQSVDNATSVRVEGADGVPEVVNTLDGRTYYRIEFTPNQNMSILTVRNTSPSSVVIRGESLVPGLGVFDRLDSLSTTVTQVADSWVLGIKSNDDLVTGINASSQGVRIFGENVVLDGNTIVDGTFTVTDTIFAPNMDISKFTVGTLNAANVNLINVNVNNLVGNTSEFIRSGWNSAAGGSVSISGSGISSIAPDNSQVYIQNGIMGVRNPSGATLGHIGYHFETTRPFYHIQTSLGTNFAISAMIGTASSNVRRTMLDIFPGSSETYVRTNDFRHVGATGGSTLPTARFSGSVMVDAELRLSGGNIVNPYGIYFNHGGSIYSLSSNSQLRIDAGTSLHLRTSNTNTALWFDNTHAYMHRTLSMEGNVITNQSDERLKRDISDTTINSLEAIRTWRIVGFNWIDEDKNARLGRQLGLIAQDTPDLALYDAQSDTWSINSSKQIMMNTHAIQQLAEREKNNNSIASAALIKAETNEEKIKRLENEVEELKRMVA